MDSPPRINTKYREITDAEEYEYFAQVRESDGFDVVPFPGVNELGHIKPIDFSRDKRGEYESVFLAKFAVDVYNQYLKDKEGEIEFVEVLKANIRCTGGFRYYITFAARNFSMGGRFIIYQTLVFYKFDGEIEVGSFRVKPEPGEEKIWLWAYDSCGYRGKYPIPCGDFAKMINAS